MKLFERYFGSNFEKLLTYYPRYYRDVFEMVEILKVQGGLADELENNIEQVFLNCFIDFADETTIRQLEIFLKIGLNNKLTLDQRRRIVKSYFIGAGKLSGSQLAKMLQNITGCTEPDIRLAPIDEAGNNALLIDFECQENAAQKLAAVQELFIRKVPAHLKMRITARSEAAPVSVLAHIGGAVWGSLTCTELPKLDFELPMRQNVGIAGKADSIMLTPLPEIERG